jgi:myo-inositol-1(or 4)-monophosphatase
MVSLLRSVIRIAEQAGELIARAPPAPASPIHRDEDPVTAADRIADRYLRNRLLALHPCGWLSEETKDSPDRLPEQDVWIVDPLDGTREFVQRVPEYAISIALSTRGTPMLAVVHNPATHDTFSAVQGGGAYRGALPLAVREGRRLEASRTEVARGEFAGFQGQWDVRPVGSIAWKLCHVAAGLAAVTLSRGPKREWDVCAGALLVTEAGGRVSDLRGEPLRFNRRDTLLSGIVAGAPRAHERALRAVAVLGAAQRPTPRGSQ